MPWLCVQLGYRTPNFTIAPDLVSSRRAAAREYLLDMLQQLAHVARAADEIQIAILLDAVVKAEKVWHQSKRQE